MNTSKNSQQTHDETQWPSHKAIPIDHPLVPSEVRKAVKLIKRPAQLFRIPAHASIEWWLMDLNGELLNVFWKAKAL